MSGYHRQPSRSKTTAFGRLDAAIARTLDDVWRRRAASAVRVPTAEKMRGACATPWKVPTARIDATTACMIVRKNATGDERRRRRLVAHVGGAVVCRWRRPAERVSRAASARTGRAARWRSRSHGNGRSVWGLCAGVRVLSRSSSAPNTTGSKVCIHICPTRPALFSHALMERTHAPLVHSAVRSAPRADAAHTHTHAHAHDTTRTTKNAARRRTCAIGTSMRALSAQHALSHSNCRAAQQRRGPSL